jgi:hypothetical protein
MLKNIIIIISILYVSYNIITHTSSLKVRLNLKKSIKNKEIIKMNGLTFDFRNTLQRIQLLLAVNEGIFNTIEIIEKEQTNPNIIGLRNCMLKIATKTPLDETDTISLKYAEEKVYKQINKAIRFDLLKLLINGTFALIIFYIIISTT